MTRSFAHAQFGNFSFQVYGPEDAYPPVPLPMGKAGAISLPNVSGVYFFWGDLMSGGRGVIYVGQASDLEKRVKLGRHDRLRDWHEVSFLMMTRDVIHYAEAYYIAVLRPALNSHNYFQPPGGRRAKQRLVHSPFTTNDARELAKLEGMA